MSDGFIDQVWDGACDVLKVVAPTLATAVLGPLAPTAIAVMRTALSLPDAAGAREVAEAIKGADPGTLVGLRTAETNFLLAMENAGIERERVANANTANAREINSRTNDWMPKVLGLSVTIGFFSLLVAILLFGLPATGGEVVLAMTGVLGGAFGAIVNYYFGSSAGSARKTEAMAALTAPPRPA